MTKQFYTQNGWEGSKYDIDLDIKEIAKRLRKQLKAKFPKCKFSITIERYSMGQSMSLSLMEAPFIAITGRRDRDFIDGQEVFTIKPDEGTHAQISQYAFSDPYDTGNSNGYILSHEAWDTMKYACRAVASYNFDDSDSMTDYFHTNFYLHPNIGKWDKPFKCTGETVIDLKPEWAVQ